MPEDETSKTRYWFWILRGFSNKLLVSGKLTPLDGGSDPILAFYALMERRKQVFYIHKRIQSDRQDIRLVLIFYPATASLALFLQ